MMKKEFVIMRMLFSFKMLCCMPPLLTKAHNIVADDHAIRAQPAAQLNNVAFRDALHGIGFLRVPARGRGRQGTNSQTQQQDRKHQALQALQKKRGALNLKKSQSSKRRSTQANRAPVFPQLHGRETTTAQEANPNQVLEVARGLGAWGLRVSTLALAHGRFRV